MNLWCIVCTSQLNELGKMTNKKYFWHIFLGCKVAEAETEADTQFSKRN